MIRSRILRVVAAGGVTLGALALASPAGADLDAGKADNQILSCSGGVTIASLNPAIQSGPAKYIKAVNKSSVAGTKFEFLSNAPVPGDNLTCFVDAGISTNQAGQDVKYVLDDQTSGNGVLSVNATAAPNGSQSAVLTGSSSCDSATTGPGYDYPDSYPLQGKVTWKFEQLNVLLKQIQVQQYIRLGRDALDANPQHITVEGIVIKGPGLGGDSSAVIDFYPTTSTKNINVINCAVPLTPGGILAEVRVIGADGTDADLLVDNWDVTIPS